MKPPKIILVLIGGLAFLLNTFHSSAQESHWKLAGIKTSGVPIFPAIREWGELPLNAREKKGIRLAVVGTNNNHDVDINAEVYFKKIPEIINFKDISFNALFTVVATGHSDLSAVVNFKFEGEWETESGKVKKSVNSGAFNHKVGRGVRESMDFSPALMNIPDLQEDFTFTFRVIIGFCGPRREDCERDLSFHFNYEWMGGSPKQVNDCFASDPGSGNSSRQTHFDWAEKQEAHELEYNLRYKLERMFNCKSMTNDKIVDLFANLSVIVARNATKACFPDDEGTRTADYSVQRKWASEQTKAELNKNLLYKIPQAFNCLNRSQQNSFFADLSVTFANGVK